MKTDGKVTPITKALKPGRHPHRAEMASVWAVEKVMLGAKRRADAVMRDAQKKAEEIMKAPMENFQTACEVMQDTCGVGPGFALDTNACKWMTRQDPADPQSKFMVVDFGEG